MLCLKNFILLCSKFYDLILRRNCFLIANNKFLLNITKHVRCSTMPKHLTNPRIIYCSAQLNCPHYMCIIYYPVVPSPSYISFDTNPFLVLFVIPYSCMFPVIHHSAQFLPSSYVSSSAADEVYTSKTSKPALLHKC